MRTILLTFFYTATLALSGLIFGCSSNDNGVDSQEPVNEPADNANVIIRVMDNRLLSTHKQSLQLSLALLETLNPQPTKSNPTGYAALSDPEEDIFIESVHTYSYQNGWHIFTFTAMIVNNVTADTVDASGTDSVQVLVLGKPVREITDDMIADGLKARAYVDWSDRASTGRGDINHRLDLSAAMSEFDTVLTIDGTVRDSLFGQESTDTASCELEIALDLDIQNLQVNSQAGENDCPLEGNLGATVHIVGECTGTDLADFDSLKVDGTWTVSAFVNDDNTVTIHYADNLKSFTVTQSCENDDMNKSAWWADRP